jgi:hypothetical protein
MNPHCVSDSSIDLVRQLADYYLPNGFYFFAASKLPEVDATVEDQQMLDRIEATKWASGGRWTDDSIGYMRCGRMVYLWAKDHQHPVFEQQSGIKGDIRFEPCVFWEYEVRAVKSRGHKYRAQIRISDFFYDCLAIKVTHHSTKYRPEELAELFKPYSSNLFPPVREQLVTLLRTANTKRREAGLEPVGQSTVGLGTAAVRTLRRMTKKV